MTKKHEYDGVIFYLDQATNGYLVVTYRGTADGDDFAVVGYVGRRENGTAELPVGWVTPRECPTDLHTHRGLAYSHVADPPTIEGQLDALCQHFLQELEDKRSAERAQEDFGQIDTRAEQDEFFNALPDA